MIERAPNKRMEDLDVPIILIVAVLAVLSVLMVSSASRVNLTGDPSYFYIRQALWFALGFAAMFAVIRYDYADYCRYWKWLYGFGVGSLLLVFAVGSVTNGAQSWFHLGPFKFEPAELMKIIFILFLAQLLQNAEQIGSFRQFAKILSLVLLPVGLVTLQPDLGTAMMMAAIVCGMFWTAGIVRRQILVLVSLAGGTLAALWAIYLLRKDLFFSLIHPYQWERLTMFLHPDAAQNGAGYQLHQSMLAIGAGQVWGEGLYRGIQTQGAWIPERHTDFIFAVIGEELGFAGAGLLLFSYCWLLLRMIKIGREARDPQGSLIAAGVVSMFLVQVFENVGMTMSLTPITGITLPLMSYGGSSILSSMLAIGLVLNVGYRRKKIKF
ncbi:rod shape-determining protein RodA [Effusibacillus pohliae]|uniref:rod shape-determining protein RodA n=1 Tax=Effusibacillus pohliae TaxID=232270 RepID=UPI000363A584|nr:rod shape-determining protein RodA [Effusibacillus pohliae]